MQPLAEEVDRSDDPQPPAPELPGPPRTAPKEAQSPPISRRLGHLLIAEGLITEEQLDQALAGLKKTNERLVAALVRLGLIDEVHLVNFLSRVYRVPTVTLESIIDPEVVSLVPAAVAKKHEVVPVERTEGSVTIAMADPTNLPALDDVTFLTGLRVVPVVAPSSAIRRAIDRAYEAPPSNLLAGAEVEACEVEILDSQESTGTADMMDLGGSPDRAPVVRLVNMIILDAIRQRASDVHLEPSDTAVRIRFRIDGVLYEVRSLPKALEPSVVSRIKVMASMDIAERRLPQDGRFRVRESGRQVDFRVSILPVIFGESVCMRILDKGALRLDLAQLGFDPWGLQQFQKAIRAANGIVLITGPTGSGKTTTLYSAIEAVNSPDINVITAEDPVEYNLKGINQLQVHDEIGRGFAAVLRSFLRHDPDVILVGEMRDQETTQIAMRAALTGHLVLTTLHTNDCPSSVARLVDMGIPSFMVAASLRLVVAQRLARRVCAACKEARECDEESLVPLGHVPQGLGKFTAYEGKGCRACSFTGLRGRIALYELMPVTDELRELIAENVRTSEIRALARQQGSKTLREAGLLKVIEGATTAKEVLRVTSD